jgi:hypothetical protein
MKVINVNPETCPDVWPSTFFYEVHATTANIISTSVVTETGTDVNIFLRTAISNNRRTALTQKFVLGLSFYNQGKIATLDLISNDNSDHQGVIGNHINKLFGAIMDEKLENKFYFFNKESHSSCLIAGACMEISISNNLIFWGTSGDFDNTIIFDVSDIASYIISNIKGYKSDCGDKKVGEAFVNNLFEFMIKFHNQEDFYEQFILLANTQGARFNDKQIASLIMMRANDRANVEDYDDIHLLMADEARKNHRRFLELAKANI